MTATNESRASSPPPKELDASIVHEEKMVSNGVVGGDYSGAVAKSDPAEIALVRKLDLMIMVR